MNGGYLQVPMARLYDVGSIEGWLIVWKIWKRSYGHGVELDGGLQRGGGRPPNARTALSLYSLRAETGEA